MYSFNIRNFCNFTKIKELPKTMKYISASDYLNSKKLSIEQKDIPVNKN
jgi:hypothetical protein